MANLAYQLVYDTGVNSVVQFGLNKTGINRAILGSSNDVLMKSAKQGVAWYLSNEVAKLVITGEPSNLTEMNPMTLLDDVVFFGVSSAIVNALDLPNTVGGFVPDFGNDVEVALISGVIMTGVNYVGNKVLPNLQNDVLRKVRHISDALK